MLTIITSKELKTIIQLCGQTIREFLSQADASEFHGEAKSAIIAFKSNPHEFTDAKIVAYGADTVKAINYPVRIEVRGATADGAAQMVAKGIWGPKRAQAAILIAQKCQELNLPIHTKLAGTSSIEFNVNGVDKALPIHFLQGAFDNVLMQMNYTPGSRINSLQTRTVIAADGDGTIYGGPSIGVLPSLSDSPVRDALIAYLDAGGVFMLVSGNDLQRTYKRLVDALPKKVFSRVLVAANGGADLVYVNTHGNPVPVLSYRMKALDVAQLNLSPNTLDMVYIGDDGSVEGNDYPAFKAVGFKNSVLVAPEFLSEYDPALKEGYVGGLLLGTKAYIENFLSKRLQTP